MRSTVSVVAVVVIIIGGFLIAQQYYEVSKTKDEKISFYKNELTRSNTNLQNKNKEILFLKKEIIRDLKDIKKSTNKNNENLRLINTTM